MTLATIEQIAEAAAKPLADVPELTPVRNALAKINISAAIEAARHMGKLRVTPGEAVAHQMSEQQKEFGYLDCIDIVDAIVYEAFGEI